MERYFNLLLILFFVLSCTTKNNDGAIKNKKDDIFSKELDSLLKIYIQDFDTTNKVGYFYIIEFSINTEKDSICEIYTSLEPIFIKPEKNDIKKYYLNNDRNYMIIEFYGKNIGTGFYNPLYFNLKNSVFTETKFTGSIEYPKWIYKIKNGKLIEYEKRTDIKVFP